jgi:hypothetical protein
MADMEPLEYFEGKVAAFQNATPCPKHGSDHLVMCRVCDSVECMKCSKRSYCHCYCDYDSRGWD